MKNVLKIILVGIVGIVLAGCAGGISEEAKQAVGWSNAPQWVIDGNDGGYSAVGDALIVDRNVQFARSEATAAARGELVKRIQSNVVTNLSKEGIRVDDKLNETVSSVVTEIANSNLQGVGVEKTWIDDQGTRIFVLVRLNKDAQKALEAKLGKQFDMLSKK